MWDVIDFISGGINAYASDNLAGAGRQEQESTAGRLGAATGDLVATVQGAEEATAGGAGVAGGVSLSATGEGALVGVPLAVVSAPVAAHGVVTATEGAAHLGADAADAIHSAMQSSTTSKPHGNTAGDQPAELYEKYDANGNFEKHGVSQDASKRYSKKQVNGGTVKVTDRGPRKEMLQNERQKVETNPGPKTKEPWAGARKEDPNQ